MLQIHFHPEVKLILISIFPSQGEEPNNDSRLAEKDKFLKNLNDSGLQFIKHLELEDAGGIDQYLSDDFNYYFDARLFKSIDDLKSQFSPMAEGPFTFAIEENIKEQLEDFFSNASLKDVIDEPLGELNPSIESLKAKIQDLEGFSVENNHLKRDLERLAEEKNQLDQDIISKVDELQELHQRQLILEAMIVQKDEELTELKKFSAETLEQKTKFIIENGELSADLQQIREEKDALEESNRILKLTNEDLLKRLEEKAKPNLNEEEVEPRANNALEFAMLKMENKRLKEDLAKIRAEFQAVANARKQEDIANIQKFARQEFMDLDDIKSEDGDEIISIDEAAQKIDQKQDLKKAAPKEQELNFSFFMACLSGPTALKIYGSILALAALALAGFISLGAVPAVVALASTAAAIGSIGFFYCAGRAERDDALDDDLNFKAKLA